MLNIIFVIFLYVLVFFISEISHKKLHTSFLASRKTAHVLGSFVSFFLPFFVSRNIAVGIGIFFAIFIAFAKQQRLLSSINSTKRPGIGEVVFPLGIALAALFVWPVSIIAFQYSCIILGLSDGLAGYIGERFGKRMLPFVKGRKTLLGSSTFFLTTAVILVLYLFQSHQPFDLSYIIIIPAAVVITVTEALIYNGWDNLAVPIISGLTLLLLVA
jgi:dolichol kinase